MNASLPLFFQKSPVFYSWDGEVLFIYESFFLKNLERVFRNAGLGDGEYPRCILELIGLNLYKQPFDN